MTEHPSDRAQFRAMTEGTQEDWAKIATASVAFNRDLPNRVLVHLQMLKGDCGGFAVDRLEHSLQSATLAYRSHGRGIRRLRALARHGRHSRLLQPRGARRHGAQALRLGGKLVDAASPRHLPGLLFLPL